MNAKKKSENKPSPENDKLRDLVAKKDPKGSTGGSTGTVGPRPIGPGPGG